MFLVHPTSIAAVDGSTVEFTCTANDTSLIEYNINGSSEIVNTDKFEQLSFETVGYMTINTEI